MGPPIQSARMGSQDAPAYSPGLEGVVAGETSICPVDGEAGRLLAERHPDRPLKTNVEFYTAAVIQGIGLPPALYPSIFALARHAGWTAHVLEQARANRPIRPAVRYVGPQERHLPEADPTRVVPVAPFVPA